jgi:CheY-like chemotaxis protein/nitrogen-specific signal transduction histidine kinase
MLDEHGNITHYVSARTDITHQKEIEQHANLLREKAETLAKTKTMFLANMSHEIRTPLNGIQGSIDILLDTQLDQEQKELALMVHHSTKSLNVIVDDILDFSKMEANKIKLENIVIDYNYIVDDVIKLFKEQAAKKEIQLIKEFPKDYPKTLLGDPTRIRQILTNVVSNAVKFTNKGEVKITVEFKPCQNNRFCIHTIVKDTGIGMNEAQVDKLFDVFNQADNTTTRLYGGTGLGASICKKIIELLGGELKVQSKQNEGTTFQFAIPLEFSEKTYLNENTIQKPQRQYNKTAIVAEDNPINLKLAEKTLATLGIETIFAVNGQQAVDLAHQKDHDFILMDIQMPVMSGLKACETLIKEGYEKPIVALTANVLEEDIQSYQAAGMKDCIPKPFKIHKIVEVLDKLY